MFNSREVCPDVMWVGGSDRRMERFENLFPLPEGITYNSYLILDEKVALLDAVDASVVSQFHENLDKALNGRAVDYLDVHHVEPDHCSHIQDLCSRYPKLKIVGNLKTFQSMR